MKRKSVIESRGFAGKYEFWLNDIEEIALILVDAYGSFDLEIDDYNLDGLAEIPQLRKEIAREVLFATPSTQARNWDSPRLGLTFGVTTDSVFIIFTDKYEHKAIGLAKQIEDFLALRKIGDLDPRLSGVGILNIPTADCTIHLKPNPVAAYLPLALATGKDPRPDSVGEGAKPKEPESKPTSSGRDDILDLRPNVYGVGINLRALWRRWKGTK